MGLSPKLIDHFSLLGPIRLWKGEGESRGGAKHLIGNTSFPVNSMTKLNSNKEFYNVADQIISLGHFLLGKDWLFLCFIWDARGRGSDY